MEVTDQLWADSQFCTSLLGLVNTLDDAVRVSLKIQCPLVEVTRTQRDEMHFCKNAGFGVCAVKCGVRGRAMSSRGLSVAVRRDESMI